MTARRFIVLLATLAVAACTQSPEVNVLPPGGEEVVTIPQQRLVSTAKKKVLRQELSEPTVPVADRPFVPKAPGLRISHVNVPGKYVAVTFDDGPNPTYTPQVLDILRRHGARATFFVTGANASRNPGILARAVAEGHEIANHTYSHIKMTAVGRETVKREIERTNEIIKSATGYYPTAMRPPYGAINSGLVDMVHSRFGMPAVLWDVDTRDWQHPGVDTVVRRAVGNARSGSVILLHDIHASTLAAVEDIVTGLQARGFKLVTVSQMIEIGRKAAGGAADGGAAAGGSVAEPVAVGEATESQPPAGAGEAVIGTNPELAEEPTEQPTEQPELML